MLIVNTPRTKTPRLEIVKPQPNESYNIADFNDNYDIIDDKLAKRATTRTAGNIVQHDANGDLADAGKAVGDLIPKPATATENNFASFTSAKNVKDSGKKAADFATAQGLSDLKDKLNKIVTVANADTVFLRNEDATLKEITFAIPRDDTNYVVNYNEINRLLDDNCVSMYISNKTTTGFKAQLDCENANRPNDGFKVRFYAIGGIVF